MPKLGFTNHARERLFERDGQIVTAETVKTILDAIYLDVDQTTSEKQVVSVHLPDIGVRGKLVLVVEGDNWRVITFTKQSKLNKKKRKETCGIAYYRSPEPVRIGGEVRHKANISKRSRALVHLRKFGAYEEEE